MKTRTDLLNYLATKHNLKRYLEIGVQDVNQNFNKIKCQYKVGVDPLLPNLQEIFGDTVSTVHSVTSDEFFKENLDTEKHLMPVFFDLIFIDGLHTAEQVQKDFENALKCLSPNGFIVLHDCNPLKEEHTIVPRPTERGHWNGDVYRFAITVTSEVFTNDRAFTVDIDNGMVVYRSGQDYRTSEIPVIEWSQFDQHRKELLNLISWDEFVNN